MTQPSDATTTRRNTLALIGDFVLFSIGFAFYDPLVVVPAFVNEFTGSELLVGVLAALRVLFITVPQIWAASLLDVQPRMKPLLVWSSVGGRLPILLLAAGVLLWAETQTWLVILILALSVMVFFTSEGLNSVSWPALVGKVVPASFRGRFFGLGQFLSSAGAAVAGYCVNRVLAMGSVDRADRWALLFVCGFVGLMLSVGSMLFIRERSAPRESNKVDIRRSLAKVWRYLKEDSWLRRMIVAQLVLATEDRRPTYLATSGILASVTVLNPIIVGALFETLRPELVFGVAALLALIGLALTWTLRKAVAGHPAPAS